MSKYFKIAKNRELDDAEFYQEKFNKLNPGDKTIIKYALEKIVSKAKRFKGETEGEIISKIVYSYGGTWQIAIIDVLINI